MAPVEMRTSRRHYKKTTPRSELRLISDLGFRLSDFRSGELLPQRDSRACPWRHTPRAYAPGAPLPLRSGDRQIRRLADRAPRATGRSRIACRYVSSQAPLEERIGSGQLRADDPRPLALSDHIERVKGDQAHDAGDKSIKRNPPQIALRESRPEQDPAQNQNRAATNDILWPGRRHRPSVDRV